MKIVKDCFSWMLPRNIFGRLCLIKSEKLGVLIILRRENFTGGKSSQPVIKKGSTLTCGISVYRYVEDKKEKFPRREDNIEVFMEH